MSLHGDEGDFGVGGVREIEQAQVGTDAIRTAAALLRQRVRRCGVVCGERGSLSSGAMIARGVGRASRNACRLGPGNSGRSGRDLGLELGPALVYSPWVSIRA